LECFTSLLNYFRCCTTFIDIISLASAECFSSLSLFTRFYPPVGKALLLWFMNYIHNLKIYRQPDTLDGPHITLAYVRYPTLLPGLTWQGPTLK
jgi:hypothetical protein